MFNHIKTNIYERKVQKYYDEQYKLLKKKNSENNIYLIGTPEHNNIGDQAIALAELEVLKESFDDYNIYEISGYFYCAQKDKIQSIITQEDIILIHGGGFLGDLWLNEEEMVRDIMVRFPDNKIIILPQTMFFLSGEGSNEYNKTKQIYSKHHDLSIFVRDSNSYENLKKMLYNKRIELVPDMVLLWRKKVKGHNKKNLALFCFREDKEKVTLFHNIEGIKEIVKKNGMDISDTSTIYTGMYNGEVLIKRRENIVCKKLEEFSKAKIVITDRLHAMIMCTLVGTPCIALDNVSKKVSCVYKDWLKDVQYIKFVEDAETVADIMLELLNNKNYEYSYDYFEYHRKRFKQMLRELVDSEI